MESGAAEILLLRTGIIQSDKINRVSCRKLWLFYELLFNVQDMGRLIAFSTCLKARFLVQLNPVDDYKNI